jgi:hypothetical protein
MRVIKIKKDEEYILGDLCMVISDVPFSPYCAITYKYYDLNGELVYPQSDGFKQQQAYIFMAHDDFNGDNVHLPNVRKLSLQTFGNNVLCLS